jgi:16S rRNA (guanine527-N7)-methyltransferase
LAIYEELLKKWNRKVNLVSRETIDDIWLRHFQDSLRILPQVQGKKVIDLGSGAGFPGLLLAMLGDVSVTCVEPNHKKILFLQEVARATHTRAVFLASRAENLEKEEWDIVCARAFTDLEHLIDLTEKLSKGKRGVFLKGRTILSRESSEMAMARRNFDFQCQTILGREKNQGPIILVNEIKRRKVR